MAQSTYDYNRETHCDNGSCHATIYPDIRFVPEDGVWVSIREADRLDNKDIFSVKFIDDDKIHGIEIINYSYSCITIKPYPQDILAFEYNTNIPIKIDGSIIGYIKIPSILSPLINVTFCPSNGALVHRYSFGEDSTTFIFANYSNSGFLNDENCDNSTITSTINNNIRSGHSTAGLGTYYKGFLDFNTSSILEPSDIINVTLGLSVTGNFLNTSTGIFLYNASYGTLNTGDWNIQTGDEIIKVGWLGMSQGVYYNFTIPETYIIKEGTTQFILLPNTTACADASNYNAYGMLSGSISDPFLEIEFYLPLNWSSNMTNSTIAGNDILHSVLWTSAVSLSGYVFSWHNGSNWTDGDCSSYSTGSQCESFGCMWDMPPEQFYDNFESGSEEGYTDDNNKFSVATEQHNSGSYSLRFDGGATDATFTLANPLDLSSATSGNLTWYAYVEAAVDNGEYCCLDLSPDGSEWYNGAIDTADCADGNPPDTEDVWFKTYRVLNSTFFTDSFKFRFRCDTSAASESIHIDDVNVSTGGTGICSGTPNYEFKNDTWVSMTGTENWSNVTKSVNINTGASINWTVYANNSGGIWNQTEIFGYITTSEGGETCWVENTDDHSIWIPTGCIFGVEDYLERVGY